MPFAIRSQCKAQRRRDSGKIRGKPKITSLPVCARAVRPGGNAVRVEDRRVAVGDAAATSSSGVAPPPLQTTVGAARLQPHLVRRADDADNRQPSVFAICTSMDLTPPAAECTSTGGSGRRAAGQNCASAIAWRAVPATDGSAAARRPRAPGALRFVRARAAATSTRQRT